MLESIGDCLKDDLKEFDEYYIDIDQSNEESESNDSAHESQNS